MKSYKDITGQQFGYLTAIKPVGKNKHRAMMWLCQCVCGKEVVKRGNSLTTGHVKSCGCKRKELIDKHRLKGLQQSTINRYIGEKYNRLTITELFKEPNGIYAGYQCECGNTGISQLDQIKKGETKSCGCLLHEKRKEQAIVRMLKVLAKRVTPPPPPTPSPLKGRHPYCEIKHKYDNYKLSDGGVILYHAGVRLNSKGRIGNHLYWAKCKCGRYTVATNHNIRKDTLNCPHCTLNIKRRQARKTNRIKKKKYGHIPNRDVVEKRNKHQLIVFKNTIKEKYYYTCRVCGASEPEMDTHHLKSFSQHPKYRAMTSNGVLLCKSCHKAFHDEMGYTNTTPKDFMLFYAINKREHT